MKITVVGAGYVGLSNAVLLALQHEVVLLDVLAEKVNLINQRISPISDVEIERYFKQQPLNLTATTEMNQAYLAADYVVIATPTDYEVERDYFNTDSVDEVIKQVRELNPQATIIIKSTVPIGYTKKANEKYQTDQIIFSPEFLREGKALYDNLHPARIIIGSDSKPAKTFAQMLAAGAIKAEIPLLFTNSTEAEAIKLFSNTYLAMRVAFFNELDTFAELKNLDAQQIIAGVCLDPRIGDYYNNPSFGYGGYCLPKDTKQLLVNYDAIPQNLIAAIVESNETRKRHISKMIIEHQPRMVGIYRLTMKLDSDNFRQSAIQDIMTYLANQNIKVVVYEPLLAEPSFAGFSVIEDLAEFKQISDIILINRYDQELDDIRAKVYTRDIFLRD